MQEARNKTSVTSSDLPAIDFNFDVWIAAAFVDVLLETLFRYKDNTDFLIDGYDDIFKLISKFGW
jgi:hypothetical protein